MLFNLSNEDKKIYNQIVTGIDNFVVRIKISCNSKDQLERIMNIVHLENPMQFYYSGYNVEHILFCNDYFVLPNYTMKESEVKRLKKLILELVNNKYLSYVKGKNDFERIIVIHDLICKTVTYKDYNDAHSIKGAVLNDLAVCDGISLLFKLICDYVGIECCVVTGLAQSSDNSQFEPHAWNRVKINGECYNVDVTFDLTTKVKNFIRHDYLFLSDDEFHFNHRFNRLFERCCKDKTQNYYFLNKLVMDTPTKFTHWLNKQLLFNKKIIEFRLPKITKPEALNNNIQRCIVNSMLKGRIKFVLYPNLGLNVFVLEFL